MRSLHCRLEDRSESLEHVRDGLVLVLEDGRGLAVHLLLQKAVVILATRPERKDIAAV